MNGKRVLAAPLLDSVAAVSLLLKKRGPFGKASLVDLLISWVSSFNLILDLYNFSKSSDIIWSNHLIT